MQLDKLGNGGGGSGSKSGGVFSKGFQMLNLAKETELLVVMNSGDYQFTLDGVTCGNLIKGRQCICGDKVGLWGKRKMLWNVLGRVIQDDTSLVLDSVDGHSKSRFKYWRCEHFREINFDARRNGEFGLYR